MLERGQRRTKVAEYVPVRTPDQMAREIMGLIDRDSRPRQKPLTRPPQVVVGPMPEKIGARPVQDTKPNQMNEIDVRINQIKQKIAALEAGKAQAIAEARPAAKTTKPLKTDAVKSQKQFKNNSPTKILSEKITGVVKENPKKIIGAAVMSALLVPISVAAYNYSGETKSEESVAVSGDGILRFRGETGIAAAVSTTEGNIEIVPSEQTGLRAEIDSHAYMSAHISPENFSKFVTVEDTDDQAVKKVTIDRTAMVVGFEIPKTEDLESEDDLRDVFHAEFVDAPEEGSRLIPNEKVSQEEEELVKRAVVEQVDDQGHLSVHNQSYLGASKVAAVGSILRTDVCKNAVSQMHTKYDQMIEEAYEDLGNRKGVTYQLEFKDGKYTSGAEMLIAASEGGEFNSTFRGENADRAACDIKVEPLLTPENKEKFTGVPSDG